MKENFIKKLPPNSMSSVPPWLNKTEPKNLTAKNAKGAKGAKNNHTPPCVLCVLCG
jgi:hypothetical protein